MYYIFHGDDEFSLWEAVAELKRKLGDPSLIEVNTTTLDGRTLTLAELQHVCDAIPFLGDRRLVIVTDMLARFDPQKGGRSAADQRLLDELRQHLSQMPPTTRLIFVESRVLNARNPILKLAREEAQAFVREFRLPRRHELSGWIAQRAEARGGKFQAGAVMALAAYGGDDLRLLDQEIQKLITYAGDRPVTEADVRQLVPAARQADIFAMVDALGHRNLKAATARLHELLDSGESPVYLLYMITRQFRILLQVKELLRQGVAQREIPSRLGLHPFVVRKAMDQARNFSLKQLQGVYQRLVEADEAIKMGRMEPTLTLDLLLVDLTRE